MLRGHFHDAALEAHETAVEARRLGALDLEAGAVNTEGISRGALGDVEEGARLLRRARDLALEIDSPAELSRAAANLSELLDLSGRTEEALAEVQATLPVIYAPPRALALRHLPRAPGREPALRLGRTAEAAAAMPDRVPGDAITSTGTYYAAMRANLALLRGEDDAARAALEELRQSVQANRHPQWVEVLETMTIELALREGRLDARARGRGARPAGVRGHRGGRPAGQAALGGPAGRGRGRRALARDVRRRDRADAARAPRERASRGPGSGPRARSTPRWPRRS